MNKTPGNAALAGEIPIDDNSIPIVGARPSRPHDTDGIGFTKRAKRLRMAFQRLTEQIKFDHPEWSDQQVRNEVNVQMREWENMAPGIVKQYELLEPSCAAPRRDHVDRRIEVAAMRETQQLKNLEAHLMSTPSVKDSAVRAAIAVLEHSIFSSLVPGIKESREAFIGSDALLDWAYGDPMEGTSVRSAAGIGNALHNLLDDPQNDPKMLVKLNLELIEKLAENHERIGRYCLIDGTAIPSFTRQVGTVNDAEEAIINRGTSSTFIKHERKGGSVKKWRGYEMLTITDMKSTLPLAWILISAQPTAYEVRQVLDLLFDCWPGCPMKYLVGDSEFDTNEIMRMCHEEYGVIGVFELRDRMRASIAAITEFGQPKCSGCKRPMRLTHREKWWTIDDRIQDGRPRREPIELKNARLRWECPKDDHKKMPEQEHGSNDQAPDSAEGLLADLHDAPPRWQQQMGMPPKSADVPTQLSRSSLLRIEAREDRTRRKRQVPLDPNAARDGVDCRRIAVRADPAPTRSTERNVRRDARKRQTIPESLSSPPDHVPKHPECAKAAPRAAFVVLDFFFGT